MTSVCPTCGAVQPPASNQATIEPIAWKISNTKSGHIGAITTDKEVADTWVSAGVKVDPLFAAQPPAPLHQPTAHLVYKILDAVYRANGSTLNDGEAVRRAITEVLAAQSPAAPVETDAVRHAFEAGFAAYFGPQRPEEIDGFLRDQAAAWREYETALFLCRSSAETVDALTESCRAHVAETALREVRRHCETVDSSRSETLIAMIKRTVDAALSVTGAPPQTSPVTGGDRNG